MRREPKELNLISLYNQSRTNDKGIYFSSALMCPQKCLVSQKCVFPHVFSAHIQPFSLLGKQRASRLIHLATERILDQDRSKGTVTDSEAKQLAIAAFHDDMASQGGRNLLEIRALADRANNIFDDQTCGKMELNCLDYPGNPKKANLLKSLLACVIQSKQHAPISFRILKASILYRSVQ